MDINDVLENIEEYNPNKWRKIFIILDDVIDDIPSDKKLNRTVTELLNRGRKLNIFLLFITQSYFTTPKSI